MITLLQDLVARQAQERGDAVAIVMGGESVSYGALERRANQLARQLVDAGCRPGDRVVLLTPKSPSAIVAMLATLKAGAVYVPVDVASPAARTARILGVVEPAVLIAASTAKALLEDLIVSGAAAERMPIGVLEDRPHGLDVHATFDLGSVARQSAEPLPQAARRDDPAHILFTSGSTGVPKGVVVTHANVLAFLEWATRFFALAPHDRLSGHPPLHFDLSTFDVFGTLWSGAQLHLVPPDLLLPRQLVAFIQEHELTQWFSVPAALAYMARAGGLPDDGLPTLKRVLWCGDVLAPRVLREWMRRVPQARYTNLYGPTETTIASSYYTVPEPPPDDAAIPIGEAIPGEELLVLDAELQPMRNGDVGDLYVGGAGVTSGYWRDPEQTRRAFVPDPRRSRPDGPLYRTGDLAHVGSDGLLRFHGRVDSQVKSRGYRIELGEIELALDSARGLTEYAVVGVPSVDFEGTTICCAYAPRPGERVEVATLRAHLGERLPPYMLPTRWLELDSLPKNVNGKIDRLAVRAAFTQATAKAQ